MSRQHFGTDGVRGVVNEKLTPEFVMSLGIATGHYIKQQQLPPRVVIGRDTRLSGSMLSAAFTSGLASVGLDVVDLGIVPTGCVSYAARIGDFGLGVVISASHNPAPDNGIKLIGQDGRKLPDSAEELIESYQKVSIPRSSGEIGQISTSRCAVEDYSDFLEGLVPERLEGVRIAIDAAHGAAYELAPQVFKKLGADVVFVGCEPDGRNINAEGGATKPAVVQALTQEIRASIGVAFDGDADRAVFSDEKGRLINGDRTMTIWSAHWRSHGLFEPPIVVGTVMSNGGCEAFLQASGIQLERTPVGDKHVSQRMLEVSAKVGGEQSGHIIFSERGPTGDGLITALELLRVLKREGRPASELAQGYEPWPQLLINVSIKERNGWDKSPRLNETLHLANEELTGRGRIVVRASGTQPMIRVMVEADEASLRDKVAEQLVTVMQSELGGRVYSRVDLTHALGD